MELLNTIWDTSSWSSDDHGQFRRVVATAIKPELKIVSMFSFRTPPTLAVVAVTESDMLYDPDRFIKKDITELLLNQNSEKAMRFNEGKAPLSYILSAPNAIEGLARVFEHGAEKYSRDNWKKGLDRNELIDSLLRHLTKIANGDLVDKDSKLHNFNHVLWNALILAEQYNKEHEKE